MRTRVRVKARHGRGQAEVNGFGAAHLHISIHLCAQPKPNPAIYSLEIHGHLLFRPSIDSSSQAHAGELTASKKDIDILIALSHDNGETTESCFHATLHICVLEDKKRCANIIR
jgi:hypothetical protein